MNQVIKPPNLAPVDPAALPMPWVNAPGFATKDGAPLDLVTLADVVRWLIPSKRMHFIPAVLALHKALAGIDGLVLYVTDQLGGAHVVGDSETFGLDTPRQGRRVISAGIGGGRVPAKSAQSLPDGVTPGTSAALYLVRRECGRVGDSDSVMASINEMLSCLAVTCEQAAILWGTSVSKDDMPATYGELVNALNLNPNNPWTDAMVALMAAEIVARSGQTGIRKGIGLQLGISVSRIGQLLTREIKRQPARGGIGVSRVVSFGGGKS